MIKAVLSKSGGGKILVLGLSERNLERLRKRQPISISPDMVQLADYSSIDAIVIAWGPSEEQIEAEIAEVLK